MHHAPVKQSGVLPDIKTKVWWPSAHAQIRLDGRRIFHGLTLKLLIDDGVGFKGFPKLGVQYNGESNGQENGT